MMKSIAQLIMLSVILLGASAFASAQSACPPGDAAREALLPLALQYKLLAHKIVGDDVELDAPADVGRDVVMLRKTLDTATQAFFRCEAADDTSPASLQQKLSAFLHTEKSKRNDGHSAGGVYGANLAVHIEPAKAFPNSLFVVLNFGIECGDDNLLFLYTKEDGQWHQRLHWYSDKYTKPSDAFGDIFFYEAVPSPVAGEPLIAVAHGHPWCTSVHSEFGLDLLRPASASTPQLVLDHITHGYVTDGEPRLNGTANGLSLHLYVESDDTDLVYHPGVLRYSTNTGKLILLPVALNARDFVDRWLQEPWSTIASWSDASNLPTLRPVHDRFDYSLHKTGDGVPGLTFGPVRQCKSAPDLYQVELDLNGANSTALPPLYAQIHQNSGSFTMLNVTSTPDRTCGPDLMRKP